MLEINENKRYPGVIWFTRKPVSLNEHDSQTFLSRIVAKKYIFLQNNLSLLNGI